MAIYAEKRGEKNEIMEEMNDWAANGSNDDGHVYGNSHGRR